MHGVLPIGCSTKGNQDSVMPPGYKALGAGRGVPQQLQMLQIVQTHCCLLRCLYIWLALQQMLSLLLVWSKAI